MYFMFDDGSEEIEALVTNIAPSQDNAILLGDYGMVLLGKQQDTSGYTVSGTAWFMEKELQEMLDSKGLTSYDDVIGRSIKIISNNKLIKKLSPKVSDELDPGVDLNVDD